MRFKTSILLIFCLQMTKSVSGLEAGDFAPDFVLPGIRDEHSIALNDYREKVVYLDFWASWCNPCRDSLPWLSNLQQELEARGFSVVAINIDEQVSDGLKFLDLYPVIYSIATDQRGRVSKQYGVNVVPTAFLIDRNQTIRQVHEGFKMKDRNILRSRIIRLLAEPAR